MRCIIVDDEYGSREALKALLQRYFPQVEVLAARPGEPLPGERWVAAAELDDFIYATAHSLRGPLATLKGLINLLKLPGTVDQDFIVDKMAYYADLLDERLYKMIYLAESDTMFGVEEDAALLQTILDAFQEDALAEDALAFVVVNTLEPASGVRLKHGSLVLHCLRNVRAFLLRAGGDAASVSLQVSQGDGLLVFDFAAPGGTLDEDAIQKIDRANVGYTEILSDPDHAEIYSAKKIISRLQGYMRASSDQGDIHIRISIPLVS